MKTNLLKSVVWTSSLVLIILSGAKSPAHAQHKKELSTTVIIKNGDTIINGKNLKNVSKAERKKLLKEMQAGGRIAMKTSDKGPGDMQVIIRKHKDGGPEEVIVKNIRTPRAFVWKDGEIHSFGPNAPLPPQFKIEMDTLMFKMDGDSAFKQLRIRMKDMDSTMQKHFEGDDFELFVHPPERPEAPHAPMVPRMRMMGRERAFGLEKNVQNFDYASIDKDGISNTLRLRVSEAQNEAVVKITGAEKPNTGLDVLDLNIFPSFSVSKLNLSFSLKSKGLLEVKFLDTDFKPVYTEKLANFNESYYKSIPLLKNGLYYLAVLQNGNWFIKKVVKE